MKLLVIEDDRNLSNTICKNLGNLFSTEQALDGEDGLFKARQNIFDIIILDVMLPHIDGYTVLSKLREEGITTPVLMLTARDGLDDKVRGFKTGADDYLVKPFHREELMLRLEAIIRRAGGNLEGATLTFHDITMHLQNRSATIGDQPLELQGKQYDLLEYLISNRNIILTKEQIFDRIWGFDSSTTANVVEVYASNLRKTLKQYDYDKYIKTVRGMGYMLMDSDTGRLV